MSETGQDAPDLAALYVQHRDAMHRVAASVLRGFGLVDHAADAVQDAIVSMMASPPSGVRDWEAFMVAAAKRKAIDRCRSAAVVHAGPELSLDVHDRPTDSDMSEVVVQDLERVQRAIEIRKTLAVLDDRHRAAVWQFVALEQPRREVAAELGVTGPRVSQMVRAAVHVLRQKLDGREGL